MNNSHPLSEDLTKLGQDDLDKRYTELMRRYSLARRMGMDGSVLHQLDLMLDGIEYEKQRRMIEPSNPDPVVIDTDRNTMEKK